MDLVIDERDSNVSSSKSGDDEDQDDDEESLQPPHGHLPQPPTSSSRASSYNQFSPDDSTTPSTYNLSHHPKSVSIVRQSRAIFYILSDIVIHFHTCFIF